MTPEQPQNRTSSYPNDNSSYRPSNPPSASNDADAWRQDSGQSDQLRKEIKSKWDRLSDDDIDLYAARRDQFFNKLESTYGLPRDQAEKEMQGIEKACGCANERPGNQAA